MDQADRQSGSYQSYLLRLWCEKRNGHVAWCASLESVQTRECYRFTSVQALFVFFVERLPEGDQLRKDDAPYSSE